MGWQINNGPDELPVVFPAVQFRPSLYQPELIKELLSAGNLADAIVKASKLRKQPIKAVHLGQVLPPSVTITSPEVTPGGLQVTKTTLDVKATAQSTGAYPVTALRLLLDGRPYDGEKGIRVIANPRIGAAAASWTVMVPPGPHFLAVQAESAVSKRLSSAVEVVAAEKGQLPALYMVVIGVSAYPGQLRLHFAASDAELIARTFEAKSRGILQKVEVRKVLDQDATRSRILQELQWLRSVMTPNDVAIFFFSGHGARDPDGKFYLVPVDVNGRDLEGSCVSGALLKQYLGNTPGKIIAMLDACHWAPWQRTLSRASRITWPAIW